MKASCIKVYKDELRYINMDFIRAYVSGLSLYKKEAHDL